MKNIITFLMLCISAVLLAQAATLPYTQNFDASSSLPEGWTIYISDGTSAYAAPYPAYYHSEPYCLYFWNSNAPLENSHIIAAGPYINSSDFSNLTLSFWALGYSEYDMPSVRLGFLSTADDPTSFTEFDSYTLSGNMSYYSYDLNWVRTDYQIAYEFVPNDGTQGMALDDIYIGESGGVVGAELPYFQDFDDSEYMPDDWQSYVSDESNEYIYVYSYYSHSDPNCIYYWKSDEPQAGDYMFVGGPFLDNEQLEGQVLTFWASCYTNSTYPSIGVGYFDSLEDPESYYEIDSFELTEDMQKFEIEFYPVRSIFQLAFRFNSTDAEQGMALDDVYIGEPGGDIQTVTLPYAENFNEAWYNHLPSPWEALVSSSSEYTEVNIDESYGVDNSPCMYMYNSNDTSEELLLIAVGPAISDEDFNGTNSLYFESYSSEYSESFPSLKVGYMTDPSDPDMFITLDTFQLTSGYMNYEVNLLNVLRGASYIAFKMCPTEQYQSILIDNIEITDAVAEPQDDLPCEEMFDSCGFPATGWSEEIVNYGSGPGYDPEWSAVIQNTYPNCEPYEGDSMGIVNGLSRAGGQGRYYTPSLDLSTYAALRLELWVMHSADMSGSPYDQEGIQIQYSTDENNWYDIGAFIPRADASAPAPYWKKHVIDLTDLADSPSMYIGMLSTSMFSGYAILVDAFQIVASTPTAGGLYISEVCDNLTGQADNTGFIELVNNTSYSLDLSGYRIHTGTADAFGGNFVADSPEVSYDIPDGTFIQKSGGILVIGCGASDIDFRNAWGISGDLNYLPGTSAMPITNDCAYEIYDPNARAGEIDASPVVYAGDDMVQETSNIWTASTPANATPGELGNEQTLPVELTSFCASVVDDSQVMISWVTASESGILGYQLLRGTTNSESDAIYLTSSIIPGQNQTTENRYYYQDEDISDESELFYWVVSLELSGASQMYGPVSVVLEDGGDEPEAPEVIVVTQLNGNFPNPFNPETNICFDLAGEAGEMVPVTLEIFNVRGQKVKTLVNGLYPAGKNHKVMWNGTDENEKPVSSGIFFYRLKTQTRTCTGKSLLLK